jgi:Bacterial TSP3 repeat
LRIRDDTSIPTSMVPDTDGDGVNDVKEVELLTGDSPWGGPAIVIKYPTNPPIPDSDRDGLPDGFVWDNLTDWDVDGINDLFEFVLGLRRSDSDGDGFSDSREVQLGLDPFAFTPASTDSSGPVITLSTPTSANCPNPPGCKVTFVP